MLLGLRGAARTAPTFAATYGELLDELASTRWRYKPGSWATLGTSVSSDIRPRPARSASCPRSVNLLAERGTLQVTVVNGLDDVVEDIRLELVPNNPRIQIVEQPGPITIETRVARQRPRAGGRRRRGQGRDQRLPHDGRRHPVIGTPATIRGPGQPARRRRSTGSAAPSWASCCWPASLATVLKGTSRVDEIADIEAVTAAHAARRADIGSSLIPPRMTPSQRHPGTQPDEREGDARARESDPEPSSVAAMP